jgi:hypothetical protein
MEKDFRSLNDNVKHYNLIDWLVKPWST